MNHAQTLPCAEMPPLRSRPFDKAAPHPRELPAAARKEVSRRAGCSGGLYVAVFQNQRGSQVSSERAHQEGIAKTTFAHTHVCTRAEADVMSSAPNFRSVKAALA